MRDPFKSTSLPNHVCDRRTAALPALMSPREHAEWDTPSHLSPNTPHGDHTPACALTPPVSIGAQGLWRRSSQSHRECTHAMVKCVRCDQTRLPMRLPHPSSHSLAGVSPSPAVSDCSTSYVGKHRVTIASGPLFLREPPGRLRASPPAPRRVSHLRVVE